MHKYFNPGKFLAITEKLFPIIVIITGVILTAGVYFALIKSPPDYQQGNAVRIMYVHVPAAWMALGGYVIVACFNCAGIIWKNPLSYMSAIAIAPIGAIYTGICLITGAIWGKPIWGTWWVWDARLTSVLILLFLYIGYIILYHAYDNKEHGAKVAAIFSIIGVINIPIIKFSVQWWNTLHQPASIIRSEGIAIHSSMLTPLLLMFAAYIGVFLIIFSLRVKTEILKKKIERIEYQKLR